MADALKLRRRRLARATGFAVGGGVALTLLLAAPAGAQDVVVQDATVVNAGAGVANSGGNVAEGNESQNTATNTQTASGFLGANLSGGAGNRSNGTASVTTGSATAVGNSSNTTVGQSVTTGGAGPVDVVIQSPAVVNVGAGVANSGGNVAVGNASDNEATNDQDADGALAVNAGGAGNASNGTATVVTGAATAVGSSSTTTIDQSAATGADGGLGLDVVVQAPVVVNAGLGVANSGLNWAVGNTSDNEATNDQDADGLVAVNLGGGAGNASNGTASVVTGPAVGIGNLSFTHLGQEADTGDAGGPDIVVQPAFVLNAGWALANSGFNTVRPNQSTNVATNVQVVNGIVAANLVDVGNASNGNAFAGTGAATGIGNLSFTHLRQRLA